MGKAKKACRKLYFMLTVCTILSMGQTQSIVDTQYESATNELTNNELTNNEQMNAVQTNNEQVNAIETSTILTDITQQTSNKPTSITTEKSQSSPLMTPLSTATTASTVASTTTAAGIDLLLLLLETKLELLNKSRDASSKHHNTTNTANTTTVVSTDFSHILNAQDTATTASPVPALNNTMQIATFLTTFIDRVTKFVTNIQNQVIGGAILVCTALMIAIKRIYTLLLQCLGRRHMYRKGHLTKVDSGIEMF